MSGRTDRIGVNRLGGVDGTSRRSRLGIPIGSGPPLADVETVLLVAVVTVLVLTVSLGVCGVDGLYEEVEDDDLALKGSGAE